MATHTVRVWDLPTRLFHWLLLICVAGLFATAYVPGASIDWHARLGYAVCTLLIFRVIWGIVGGHSSQFRNFLPSPSGVWAYLRGRSPTAGKPGHSPLGALAVVVMLLTLGAQVATGLIGDDEIAFTGPLNHLVSTAQGLAATSWHKAPGQWLIISLIVLHVGAILFYLVVRRNNLIGPMVHGDTQVAEPTVASRDTAASRLFALAVLVLCAAGMYLLVRPGPAF